jgi:hypothetical protein
MNHFAFSGGGEVIVQINSEGPFEVKYANPGGRSEQEKLTPTGEGVSLPEGQDRDLVR